MQNGYHVYIVQVELICYFKLPIKKIKKKKKKKKK